MFENKTIAQIENELNASTSDGLSTSEASDRLLKNGFNKLEEKKKKHWILVFLSQFNDPMVYVLLAAAVLSIAVSAYSYFSGLSESFDWIDTVIILGVVVLNSIIGTVQESKAEKSLEALKKMSSPTTTVKRDGKILTIKAEELVVGDIVILEEGQVVPADLRLIKTANLKTDESSLTGESLPVEKDANFVFSEEVGVGDRVNIAYMSTPVVYGHGEGVVVATGMNTEIGKIAKLLSSEEDQQTPLQKKLAKLSKFLGLLVIIIVVIIFGVELLQMGLNEGLSIPGVANTFMLSISIAVAAIPEGLPAVVTIVLALGMRRMVKVNTIVRKLPSVETLGATKVVCSDKTGTLTQNKMTVVEAYILNKQIKNDSFNKDDLEILAKGMALCSNASIDNGVHGDPTEIALLEFAKNIGLSHSKIKSDLPRVDELPFDSVRKMMSTMHKNDDEHIIYTKGAIDSILKHTTHILDGDKVRKITKEDIDELYRVNDDMSHRALRVLALGYHLDNQINEENIIFVGLTGMVDPPRPEAKSAVEIFKQAGITTIMITGDHKTTAFAIAKELGIVEDIDQTMSGAEIDALSFEELKEKVKTVHVFARVSPENKVSIVKAVQANGNIAAMTGDGVNDAPSLKAADIGIAMGITGTDVAKGAADMVLTDDNFASIEKAVEEGRGIYANIKKTVIFLLSSNIAEVLAIFIAIVLGLPEPLIAIHILWVNLITDSLPAVALGADEKEKDIMHDQPRDPKESLFAKGGYWLTFGYGALITLVTLIAFLLIPMEELIGHGLDISLSNLQVLLNAGSVLGGSEAIINGVTFSASETALILKEAQTAGFTVLALSELTHMLGMTSIRKSFIHNFKTKNKMLWIAFAVGLGLQIFVVEVPGVNDVFSCYQFNDIHWLYIALLSLAPLFVHEIVALILFIIKKVKNKSKIA